MISLTSLPDDTVPLIAQYLNTLHDRFSFRHTCSFVHGVSNTLDSRFFELLEGSFPDSLPNNIDFYVNYFGKLSNEMRSDMELQGHVSGLTRAFLSWIVRGSRRLMEQYGFLFSRHVTDGFFYCMVVHLMDQSTPKEVLDVFLSECRYNSSFWNSIDGIAGQIYPRVLFYGMFEKLCRDRRLSQMLPLLYNDAGIRVFTIEFDKELTSNSSEPMFNPLVTSFTVVHLAARLKDLEALKLMHSMRKGVINVQTLQRRTALQLCLDDPNMYDVALFLLENCSPNLSLGSISLDDTHPLTSKLRETLARSREKPPSRSSPRGRSRRPLR